MEVRKGLFGVARESEGVVVNISAYNIKIITKINTTTRADRPWKQLLFFN